MKQLRMQTFTGLWVDPLNLTPADIDPRDIAHHLALINRYGGASPYPYPVAQHSMHVCRRLPAELMAWGLLHDAHEAYTGDVISPIKKRTPLLEEHALAAQRAIAARFNLTWPEPPEIRTVDLRVGATECAAFGIMVTPGREAQAFKDVVIEERPWRLIKAEYMALLASLVHFGSPL